jgi:CheY-like chemotaxis protein
LLDQAGEFVSFLIAGPINPTHQRATRAGKGEVFPCHGQNELQNCNIKGAFPDMRPKKVILCVDDNEQELSVLSFMLSTNGYRVVSACTGQDAIGIFGQNQVDLVLADFAMPKMNGNQLVDRLKQMAPHIPMILLGDPQKMGGEMHTADALLAKRNCSPQELLERIKVMSVRKRGPRKGAVRMTPMVELAAAS